MATIYTIGHSTRSLDELVAALRGHGVATLVDIRSFPMSRRLPHFNRESLEQELPKHGITYVWLKELGGRRKKVLQDSPNTALRHESFRNYADYMMTEEFEKGIARLLEVAAGNGTPTPSPSAGDKGGATAAVAEQTAGPSTVHSPDPQKSGSEKSSERSAQDDELMGGTAIMCAERVYFKCHRMLVSDYLTAHGNAVLHIDDEKRPVRQHTLMAGARVVEGKLVYDGGRLL